MNNQAVKASASAQLNELATQLAQGDKSFFAQRLSFSFWDRGGDPGEGFTSDKLEIVCEKQKCEATFIRTRFDEQFSPPYLAEQFTRELPLEDVTNMLKLVVCSNLFRKEYPSETKPPIADLLKETWVLSRREMHFEKTFFEPFPDDFVAIRMAGKDLMNKIEKKGNRHLLNEKRE